MGRRQRRKEKKAAEAEEGGASKGGAKHLKKAERHFRDLEEYIDGEFEALGDMYDREELETLRWNYRLDQVEEYHLTEEELRYFVAKKEAAELGLPEPPLPAAYAQDAKGSSAAEAAAPASQYERKSQVDMALVDKYLDRHISRDSTSEMARIYKEAFGEELHVPEKLSLVDLTYGTGSIGQAHKVTKAEIFGTPEEAAAEEAAAEGQPATVEAAPAVAGPSKTVQFATAFKRGVPEGPGTGERFRLSNPGRLWTIPKRFAGNSVGRYYILFAINLVLFFILLLPRLILYPIILVIRIIKKIVAPRVSARVGPRLQGLQAKLAEPPKAAPQKPSN